jgi:hypothetical protein
VTDGLLLNRAGRPPDPASTAVLRECPRHGVIMGVGKSLASFRSEAAKCVLVCANCHGEIEVGLVAARPPGPVGPGRPR